MGRTATASRADERLTVRPAGTDDIAALLAAAEQFVRLSGWNWTFDREAANARIWGHLQHDDSIILICESAAGALLAAAVLQTDRDYTVERLGYIVKFYVTREGRRTSAPRLLVEYCTAWFRERGCAAVFATSTARLPLAEKTYANLLGKHGFTVCGPTLTLDLAHG